MKIISKLFRFTLYAGLFSAILGALAIATAYYYIAPNLPPVNQLRDVRFQVPLQVFTQDKQLIAEYGSKKREPLGYDQIPQPLIEAIISIEDERFFEHPGVDYKGLIRAAVHLISTGKKGLGGSTITMQVARNFFLSREKTYLRKISEIFLAIKIEQVLTKEQILELYINKIYLGNRAYGFGSAAQIYYGKPIQELDLAQTAMLAGLPKAPSRYNPIANPERATIRRDYILDRMLELDYINIVSHEEAQGRPVTAGIHKAAIDLEAPYIGEMVRAHLYEQHGEDTYTEGFKVYVTVNPELQLAAQAALRKNLLAYDRRHGFRGPVETIPLNPDAETDSYVEQMQDLPLVGGLVPALIFDVHEQSAVALDHSGNFVTLPWEGLSWAKRYLDTDHQGPPPERADEILSPGDVIYIHPKGNNEYNQAIAHLAQVPTVAGAVIALDPRDGALIAVTGGFDFFYSKFNRATQAKRQMGSSFKPFVYSAALDKGFTAATIVNDAPVVFDDPGLESSWRPENYSGRFYGPTRLRLALTKSRNLVSIRMLQTIGIRYAVNYVERFGFDTTRLPKDLSLSLGSAAFTPLELASAYTVLANGGYKVEPYFIERIEDVRGDVIFQNKPLRACPECEKEAQALAALPAAAPLSDIDLDAIEPVSESAEPLVAEPEQEQEPERDFIPAERIISPQTHYLITSMLRDVIKYGTGRKALKLRRNDLAGKTGTTNDQRDAWFSGFNSDIVAISWTGFDDSSPLGRKETGASAALPIWIDFMETALKGMPETPIEQPEGLVTVRIDTKTGLLAAAGQRDVIFETFREENVPTRKALDVDDSVTTIQNGNEGDDNGTTSPQMLF